MTVVANPGIPTKDLHFRFEFALQPAALDDLITILEASGCLTLCEEVFESMQLSSPFQDGEREGVARNSAQIDSSGTLFSPTLTVPKVEKGS
uniref:Transposase n=1 Tax=Heterorhabditis bacteriophora TaxID=37862 RepID=A0A1I7XRR6_HETBA